MRAAGTGGTPLPPRRRSPSFGKVTFIGVTKFAVTTFTGKAGFTVMTFAGNAFLVFGTAAVTADVFEVGTGAAVANPLQEPIRSATRASSFTADGGSVVIRGNHRRRRDVCFTVSDPVMRPGAYAVPGRE
ncbi:hypothetical protein [Streptosporangium sandarakinum]|uniref:hypothetical protein n=1 Tax=Streptosporangium sandarakinum TaxID=1260955 RepID=UPI00341B7A25